MRVTTTKWAQDKDGISYPMGTIKGEGKISFFSCQAFAERFNVDWSRSNNQDRESLVRVQVNAQVRSVDIVVVIFTILTRRY